MKTYLSVDVDYWSPSSFDSAMLAMDIFFHKIINCKVPIYIVKDHEELLDDINTLSFNKLINVDYHSDITAYIDKDGGLREYQNPIVPADLNCGTWVNYVEERTLGEFLWLYPRGGCVDGNQEGRCEDIEGFWDSPNSNFHNWNCIYHKKGWTNIKWNEVIAVGISLSPEWLYPELEDYFRFDICPRLEKAGAVFNKSFESYDPIELEEGYGRIWF